MSRPCRSLSRPVRRQPLLSSPCRCRPAFECLALAGHCLDQFAANHFYRRRAVASRTFDDELVALPCGGGLEFVSSRPGKFAFRAQSGGVFVHLHITVILCISFLNSHRIATHRNLSFEFGGGGSFELIGRHLKSSEKS